jgi:cytochrome c peroxidase
VPSLRNVATRHVFFHNGVFHDLRRVLEFYAERDSNPGKWYGRHRAQVVAFDDLPPEYRANVNREPPFGHKRGSAPALTGAEIDDLLAFLGTLTDADLVAH